MKASSIREQTDEELKQAQGDVRKQIFDLNLKKKVGDASEQPLRVRELRRDLARINTVITERSITAGKEAKAE